MCKGVKYLVENNYGYNDIVIKRTLVPEIWYIKDDKKHRYFCDIYIKKILKIYHLKNKHVLMLDIYLNYLYIMLKVCEY